jgi:tRNA-2-methylthio-N6-dimethylallyladenosine synthase
LSLAEEVRFDWAFMFKYSSRQGTPAADLEGWPEQLIEKRHRECLELVEAIGTQERRRFVGRTEEVLVEGDNFGRTRGNYKVHVAGDVAPGETYQVVITDAERATLEGRRVLALQ